MTPLAAHKARLSPDLVPEQDLVGIVAWLSKQMPAGAEVAALDFSSDSVVVEEPEAGGDQSRRPTSELTQRHVGGGGTPERRRHARRLSDTPAFVGPACRHAAERLRAPPQRGQHRRSAASTSARLTGVRAGGGGRSAVASATYSHPVPSSSASRR